MFADRDDEGKWVERLSERMYKIGVEQPANFLAVNALGSSSRVGNDAGDLEVVRPCSKTRYRRLAGNEYLGPWRFRIHPME